MWKTLSGMQESLADLLLQDMYNHFKMAKEVNMKLGGEWIHTQDDNFPPFFDAVG